MNRFDIILEQSPWYVVVCLLVAAAYTYILYKQPYVWTKPIQWLLVATRFTLVFILAFLLLVPMIRMLKNIIEPPTIALLVDNSASMATYSPDSTARLLSQQLTDAGYTVEWNTLNDQRIPEENIAYDATSTDLSHALRSLSQQYYQRNMQGIVLLSDGIHNTGFAPDLYNGNTPIYTIGLGDTTAMKDVALQDVKHNSVAFVGNQFPVQARIFQEGFANASSEVYIQQAGKVIASKKVTFSAAPYVDVEFLLSADKAGKQLYSIQVEPLQGESAVQNNRRDFYIHCMDGKERILLFTAGPHPDIKAIREALEVQQQVETVLYYPGYEKKPEGAFDLIIVHQFPTRKVKNDAILAKYLQQDIPMWYFISAATDIPAFNALGTSLVINQKSAKNDEVTGAKNEDFTGFKWQSASLDNMRQYPPVSVPFGDFTFKGSTEHILFQQLGSLVFDKPLLTVVRDADGTKNAFFVGDGLWQWRLQEYTQSQQYEGFNELIQKTARYITSKNDRRKLRVKTVSEEYFENDAPQLDVEVYNDLYEKIYQQTVRLLITHESGETREFTFVNDESKSRFSLGTLPKGVYTFEANANVNGKMERDEGQFLVKEHYLETLTTKADFALLQRISANNHGAFYTPKQLGELTKLLSAQQHPSKIVLEDEILEELIHQKWIFVLLLLLLTLEWATRKYTGGY